MSQGKDCANKGIECSVTNCTNHCDGENYCALQKIMVGANCREPDRPSGTDCRSFVEKKR